MIIKQCRRLLRKLATQRDALLGKSPDQFRVKHFGSLDRLAALEHFTDQPAFDSASDFSARALFSWVLSSPICWLDKVVLFVPMNRLDLERKSSTRDSDSATFLRKLSISPDSHWPADLACSCRAFCCRTR